MNEDTPKGEFQERFDKRFQLSFLAHFVRDSEFLDFTRGQVKPEFFSSEAQQRVIRLVTDFHLAHKSAPGDLIYQTVLDWKNRGILGEEQTKLLNTFLDDVFKVPLQNKAYLKNEFNRFAWERMMKINIIPFQNLVTKGDIEGGKAKLMEMAGFSVQQDLNLGRAYTADPTERIIRRENEDTEHFHFLIPELDRIISGMKRGELWLWQSQKSSGGKSAALVHLTRSFVFQKKKVLIYTMEMSEGSYEDRLDMNLCGLTKDYLTDRSRIEKILNKKFRQGNMIWIKQFPNGVTVDDLRDHQEKLEAIEGFYADAVMVDYLDLLSAKGAIKEDSHNIYKKVSEDLRRWAVERQLLIWSGTQSNAGGMEALEVDQQHTAGSIGKVYTVDGQIGINRTPEEQKQKIARLNIVKNRDGAAGITVKINQDFETMRFYVPGGD